MVSTHPATFSTPSLLWQGWLSLHACSLASHSKPALSASFPSDAFGLFHSSGFCDLDDATFDALIAGLAEHDMVVVEVRGHIILVKRKVGELGQYSAIELGALLRGLSDLKHTRIVLCLMSSLKILFLKTIEEFRRFEPLVPERSTPLLLAWPLLSALYNGRTGNGTRRHDQHEACQELNGAAGYGWQA